jgi:hypothetical protein
MSFLGGLLSVSKSSNTTQQATTNNYDQRQVYDAGGGIIGNGNSLDASTNTAINYNTTTIGTDPGIAQIASLNDQLLATLGDQQGDAMKVIAGLGSDTIKQLGESATNLYSQSEQNSATAWSHTVDASQEVIDKMFSAAGNVLNAGTTLAQGAMQTYQPADSKASDNQVKIALLGAAAIVLAAFIAKKG